MILLFEFDLISSHAKFLIDILVVVAWNEM
jgi:hypothetical protein